MHKNHFDLLVIGGGINGVGVANDASGRGLSVALCEKKDLAAETSSYSSKLIHGGLRYLEHYDFSLVRKALIERETLLHLAPHLIQGQSFILPHAKHLRPYFLIRLGLWLYDTIGGKQSLPKSQSVKFNNSPDAYPFNAPYEKGFSYSDAVVDDARLVVTNALAAKIQGADILNKHEFISATREKDYWIATLKHDRSKKTLYAKAIVNAAGPWVEEGLNRSNMPADYTTRLVKGSHFIVPKFYAGDHAFILQNEDKRIVFVIPYQEKFCLVGTTDVDYEGDPSKAKISEEETTYLLELINHYFKIAVTAKDIVSSFSGVRPLFEDQSADASSLTRDYRITVHDDKATRPIISIFGGKLTTYRKLSEEVVDHLKPYFPYLKPGWTNKTPLPGGDINNFPKFIESLKETYPKLDSDLITRLAKAYGTRVSLVLGRAKTLNGLGQLFGGTLYEKEVQYLIDHEWARTAEDILWRRTKQGLYFSRDQVKVLANWLKRK